MTPTIPEAMVIIPYINDISSTLADVSFLVLRPKYINFGPQVASAPTTKINAADPNVDSMKLGFEKRYCKSSFQEVLVKCDPSLSPRGGSIMTKNTSKTDTKEMMGAIRRPQCQ